MRARLSLDTNVLVYASDPTEGARHLRARDLLVQVGAAGGVLTQQVLGEFLNVGLRTPRLDPDNILRAARLLQETFPTISTSRETLFAAFDLVRRHSLQFWDAVIIAVCQANNVDALLTEDLQDGQRFGALRIVNPFEPTNTALIETLLA